MMGAHLKETFMIIDYPYLNPPVFQLGPIAPRWYAMMYIIGFVFAYLIISKHSRFKGRGFTNDDVMDYLTYAFVGVLAGGRLGYVLFYGLSKYLANPLEILYIWQGGMSFHGGLLGVIAATALYAYRKKIPLREMFDITALASPIGLFFGRLGNFITGELWGGPTDGTWGVRFKETYNQVTQTYEYGPPRHPSQLYEAVLEGLLLFVILYAFTRLTYTQRKLKPGSVAGMFLLGYGCARFAVEFVRVPDSHINYLFGTGWMTMGHLLSTPMIGIGLLMILVFNMMGEKAPELTGEEARALQKKAPDVTPETDTTA